MMEDKIMDAIKTLEDVLAKKAKNMSNENRKRAVGALLALFGEDNGAKQVAEYLIKLHYSVCQSFFEEFCLSASDENIIAIAEALVNDEQFKKGKTNNIMYPKGLSAVLALASKGKYQASFLVLSRILSQSEKAGGFSDGCVNNFKKLIADKNGMPFILNLFEHATEGEVACKEFELKRLDRFLKSLDDKGVVTSHEEVEVTSPISKSTQPPSGFVATPLSPAPDVPQQKHEKVSNGAETITRIEKNQQEILAAIRRLVDSRSSIEALSLAIARRDEEISAIKSDLAEKERRAASLASEIGVKEKQLAEMKGKIDNLTGRLRTSLQMDNISKSQELITLKNDISEALKLDYADFAKSKENPYSEDLFEAYRSTLARIFKLLKRFGITCQ
jgi:hypothetical protein